MKKYFVIQLMVLLAVGCASHPDMPGGQSGLHSHTDLSAQLPPEIQETSRLAENEALIEWQVGRMAAACNEVAAKTESPTARREALRIKAAYAASSYAIATRSSSLVQVLNLLAMSSLTHLIWVEEGVAAATLGPQAKPFQAAVEEIRSRARAHALSYLTPNEIQAVEATALTWRKDHAESVVVEFIRFEAFADEIADSASARADLGGLFGRISASTRNVEMLGARALFLATRMPRLTEWHAEAAVANLLTQPELIGSIASVKQLAKAQTGFLEKVDRFDSKLTTLPADLAGKFASQPEFKLALDRMEQASIDLKRLDDSLSKLESAVTTLGAELARLSETTRPETLGKIAEQAADTITLKARSIILVGVSGIAGLLVLQAILRRFSNRPPRP